MITGLKKDCVCVFLTQCDDLLYNLLPNDRLLKLSQRDKLHSEAAIHKKAATASWSWLCRNSTDSKRWENISHPLPPETESPNVTQPVMAADLGSLSPTMADEKDWENSDRWQDDVHEHDTRISET